MNSTEKLHFASDYMKGAHPAILEALVKTNNLATVGYGTDAFCDEAKLKILEVCECPHGEVHFLVGGTQTNATVIDAVLKPYQGIIAAASGHISTHEAGAIEYGGHKVLALPHVNGKITATAIEQCINDYWSDDNHDHMVMPGMVYISQPTEYGTMYTLEEMSAISNVCRTHKIPLFVDGARLAYALATPENKITLPTLAQLADIFYIGGTKCGLLFGEAVVFTQKNYVPHFFSIIKQHGALLAKGRLLGVQFGELFTNNLYENIATDAIAQARAIRQALIDNGYTIPIDSCTNQIFAVFANENLAALRDNVEYGFIEKYNDTHTVIRFCTAWYTTWEETNALIDLLKR